MIAVGGKGMREIAVLAGIIADEGTGSSGPVVVLLHELAATATAPSAQERLLYQILGIVEGAEHAVTMHMQLPPVALSQRREGSLLAGSHGGNDCRLFGLGGWVASTHNSTLLTPDQTPSLDASRRHRPQVPGNSSVAGRIERVLES